MFHVRWAMSIESGRERRRVNRECFSVDALHVRACGRWVLVVALGGCTQANPRFAGARLSGSNDPNQSADAGVVRTDAAGELDALALDGPGSAGLILHWRFDESTGAMAMDSSGSGVHGVYLGEPTQPQPVASVAPTGFSNRGSREFPASGRPSVRAVGGKAALQLQASDEITLSVWYRATAASEAYGGI